MATPLPPNTPPVLLPQQLQDGNVLLPAQPIFPPTENDMHRVIKDHKNDEVSIGMYLMCIILNNIIIRFQSSVPLVTNFH